MADDSKRCPFCSEKIALDAKKCRFCNEWLDGSARPRNDLVQWEGELLRMNGLAMPPATLCWICGTNQNVALKGKQFIYQPPWVWLGLLGGLPGIIIVSVIGTKRLTLQIPRCTSCRWKAGFAEAGMALLAVVGLFGFPFLGALAGAAIGGTGRAKDDAAMFGGLGGFAFWVVALILFKVLVTNRLNPRCVLIENDVARLRLARPEFARQSLSE